MRAIAVERDPDALLRVAAEGAAHLFDVEHAWTVATSEHRPVSYGSFGLDPGPENPAVLDAFLFRIEEPVIRRGPTPAELCGLSAPPVFENLAVARFALGAVRCFLFVMNRRGPPLDEEDGHLLAGLAAQIGAAWRAANELMIARATHSIHRTLVEQLPAVTYHRAVGKPGIPSFVSPQVMDLLGFTPDDVMADPSFFRKRVHPDDLERVTSEQNAYRDRGPTVPLRAEYRMHHRDGSVRWVHNHALSVRDRVDGAELVVGVIVDVTDQKLAEQARREKEQRAEERVRQAQKLEAVAELAGGIAHEFNNLLGVILGYAHMIEQRGPADETTATDLTQIVDAAERAKLLTARMLSFTGRHMVEPRVVDVAELVHGMEELLATLIGADLRLDVDIDDGEYLALIDPGELQQLLLNLVSNARDASNRGGRIEVMVGRGDGREIAREGRWIRVRVRDSGSGMDEATKARIFEPFFTTKERGKGTGLGLSMAAGVAKEAGGVITVESAPGAGSLFSVWLPEGKRRRTTQPRLRAPQEAESAPRSSETILVVEDEPALRRLVCRLLRARGYKVLEAANGHEALRLAAEEPRFDLLLTDVVMPGPTGRELFDELTRRGQARPVLFMSGYTDDTIVRHGVREAEFTLLPKPFSAAALYEKVRFVLDASSAPVSSSPESVAPSS